ncbi:TPA: hypothetical protein DF272_00735 [Candidatus Falkowbacteria bacterium]|nr:hypothetical protein [Candidatus Falkowbacteria bacterium]
MTRIGLKELRENIDKFAKNVHGGESYIVYRKSEPLFKITPLEEHWEEVIDFTKLQPGGIDIEEVLTRL